MKFKNPLNMLEGERRENKALAEKEQVVCDMCKKRLGIEEIEANYFVCTGCGHHFRIGARQRIFRFCDEGSFAEMDSEMQSRNILEFEGYDKKLEAARASGEKEGVVTGICEVGGRKVAIFVMEPSFMMGSMGSIVGEKITRLFEKAAADGLAVVGFCVSGGARMQEGIFSLMQMAKTSGAVKKHSDAGLFFISVLTNPTTGGVTASFASLGDIIIAEPGALVGFAGPKVIEQTTRKKLPVGFQRAEFIIEKGFVDMIVPRLLQKECIANLVAMHAKQQGVIVLEKAKEVIVSGAV